jgi:hypothetical protein
MFSTSSKEVITVEKSLLSRKANDLANFNVWALTKPPSKHQENFSKIGGREGTDNSKINKKYIGLSDCLSHIETMEGHLVTPGHVQHLLGPLRRVPIIFSSFPNSAWAIGQWAHLKSRFARKLWEIVMSKNVCHFAPQQNIAKVFCKIFEKLPLIKNCF